MKPTSPIESPKSLFTQPQGFKGLQVPKSSPNVIRNLGVNFEDLMPVHSDPTSPNFQRMNDILKSPSFLGSKPISMILPDASQNSMLIPLQEQCLETSMPFEDLIGQLESPKLSDKMQMIFNSNVNLSESIMKNTFRAVDESRVKLEDKDLQVELEISELKLHHLEKKVEGCLASSKNTLAMNAQLSQNVSRMVSPAKSSHTVLTGNIRTRSNSRVNTPRGNAEDSLSPFNSQLINNKREALQTSKNRPKSVNQRVEDIQGNSNSRSFPSEKNEEETEFTGQDKIFIRDVVEAQREKTSEKRVKSVSIPIQESNSRLKDSIINEAYQKLNSYFGPGDVRRSQPDNHGEKRDGEIETVQTRDSHSPSKSTELVMSNNMTFYTNLLEKDGNTEPEEHNKNMIRPQSHECLSEDQDQAQKQNFVFGSKPRESVGAFVTPLEPRINTVPREVPLVGADGKERIFILKPKETLRVERLESIFIIPVGNKGSFAKPSKVRSQFSSFQCSETEECSQIKENLKNVQDHTPSGNQTVVGSQSRVSFFDNSNIASMNLDRAEPKLSVFSAQVQHEPLGEANSSQNQKESYLNNLKLQILNHPKCQKFFARDDTMTMSTRGRTQDMMSKENDGMEFYFKQKINDFREFLNEFEKILPTETSVSPGRELVKKQKKIKQVKSFELQGINPQETLKKETAYEYGNFESRTVENTPRGLENENHESMKDKYNNMKKSVSVIGCVASPQNNDQKKKIKFVNFENNESESHYLSRLPQESPFSGSKASLSSPKSGFNSPVQSLKKKTKVMKNGNQKESLPIPSMSIKLNKGNNSINIPPNQVTEKKRAHDKSASMKSFSQQTKNKKLNELDTNPSIETKKIGKNITRGNSKSIVGAVTLNRIQQRANSVVVIEK